MHMHCHSRSGTYLAHSRPHQSTTKLHWRTIMSTKRVSCSRNKRIKILALEEIPSQESLIMTKLRPSSTIKMEWRTTISSCTNTGKREFLEIKNSLRNNGISARSITPHGEKVSSYLTAPLYFSKHVNYPFDSFYITNWDFVVYITYHGWAYKHVAAYVSLTAKPGLSPLYAYNNGRDNFYTTSGFYTYVGIACYVSATPQDGLVPLKRYLNPGSGDHFYTTGDWPYGGHGYFYEGTAAYVVAP
mmetsp:Transcript_21487/g.32511  ORF Transcript_21487/g.32511 Transcript_21487/m.32511 type:complete len:244 (+) Transcript_21487:173-904(+)